MSTGPLYRQLWWHGWWHTLASTQPASPPPTNLWPRPPQIAYLTSLLELTLLDTKAKGTTAKIAIETEPSFCGLGPDHVAVGMNNQVRSSGVWQGGGSPAHTGAGSVEHAYAYRMISASVEACVLRASSCMRAYLCVHVCGCGVAWDLTHVCTTRNTGKLVAHAQARAHTLTHGPPSLFPSHKRAYEHTHTCTRTQVSFYRVAGRALGQCVNKREYMGSVSVIKLSATHAAVLMEGKVIVHPIEVSWAPCTRACVQGSGIVRVRGPCRVLAAVTQQSHPYPDPNPHLPSSILTLSLALVHGAEINAVKAWPSGGRAGVRSRSQPLAVCSCPPPPSWCCLCSCQAMSPARPEQGRASPYQAPGVGAGSDRAHAPAPPPPPQVKPGESVDENDTILPEPGKLEVLTSVMVTDRFIITGAEQGTDVSGLCQQGLAGPDTMNVFVGWGGGLRQGAVGTVCG